MHSLNRQAAGSTLEMLLQLRTQLTTRIHGAVGLFQEVIFVYGVMIRFLIYGLK